nr:MAG TPA: hypothetical protein [Caudoviricetes sp.]
MLSLFIVIINIFIHYLIFLLFKFALFFYIYTINK